MNGTQRLIRKAGAASAIIAGSLCVAAALSVASIWLFQFSDRLRYAIRGLIQKDPYMDRATWLLALRWWLVACVFVCLLVLVSHKLASWPSWRLALLWVPPFVVATALAAALPNGFEIARQVPPGFAGDVTPGLLEYTGRGGYILWPFLALGLQIVVTAVALQRSILGRHTGARWSIVRRVGVFALIANCAWMIVLYHRGPARGYGHTGNALYLILPLLALGLQIAVTAMAVRRSIRTKPTSGRWDDAQRQGVFSLLTVGTWMILYGSIVHSNKL